ncbi:QacE family quaternary ammonium compound efflux SMR transporter [Lysinibacillus yapensis]|uniref:QacE family quaternary ammonium compound efflux SMR transporter n=1 Tax=Ureibacillus yapensis TaxID=2304605 RepID=A0A396SKU2_9BACL|nr:SMR family transporter [Lysinibacillus yapensis]RHW35828.1 QacE family quaternary ammonium compound efflux SMR transporter [Lysinibacillus yapensis]
MNGWLKVITASFLEVFWVIGLAHADEAWEWIATVIAIVICNVLLIQATSVLPTGTAYAVFVGLGTAGAVVSEILFFGEPFNIIKILLIVLLLVGVIGLKLVTDDQEKKEADEEWHGSL